MAGSAHFIQLVNAIGLFQRLLREKRCEIASGLTQITYLTSHDELTGLYTKSYLDAKIKELELDDSSLPISMIVGDMNAYFNQWDKKIGIKDLQAAISSSSISKVSVKIP